MTLLILLSFNFLNSFGEKGIYYQILGFNFNFYNNTFNGKDYNYYNGRYLKEEDKKNILYLIPQEGLKISSDGVISLFSLYYHFWNLEISFNWRTKGRIEKEVFELLLLGNRLNQIYQLEKSSGEIYVFSKIKNAFFFSFQERRHAFIGVNYLEGHFYGKSQDNCLNLLTTRSFLNLYSEVNYQISLGGYGFSFDVGLRKVLNEKSSFKVVIENLANRIFWRKENRIGKIIFQIDSLNLSRMLEDNYYSFIEETREIDKFVNQPLPIQISLLWVNKPKGYWEINSGFRWAVKEYFKVSSKSHFQIFNFLSLINSLNIYFLTKDNVCWENFSFETGLGLGARIGRFNLLVFQEYYQGIFLYAKGFSLQIVSTFTLR